jgi:hypothetical protein
MVASDKMQNHDEDEWKKEQNAEDRKPDLLRCEDFV